MKKAIAEFIGTFALVFIGCGTVVVGGMATGSTAITELAIALAFGAEGAFVWAGFHRAEAEAAETAKAIGANARAIRFDVTKLDEVDRAFTTIGRADVPVAFRRGHPPPSGPPLGDRYGPGMRSERSSTGSDSTIDPRQEREMTCGSNPRS